MEQHFPRAPSKKQNAADPDLRLIQAEERAGKKILEAALSTSHYIDQFSSALLVAAGGCATVVIANLSKLKYTLASGGPQMLLFLFIASAGFGLFAKYFYLGSSNYLRMQRECTKALLRLKREFEGIEPMPGYSEASLRPSATRVIAATVEELPKRMRKRMERRMASVGAGAPSLYAKAVRLLSWQTTFTYLQAGSLVAAFVAALSLAK